MKKKTRDGLIYMKAYTDSPGFLYPLPAFAGTGFVGMTLCNKGINSWIPAFAGMTFFKT